MTQHPLTKAALALLALFVLFAAYTAVAPFPAGTENAVAQEPETATPAPTPTLDPYAGYTIANLAARPYGGGPLQIQQTMAATADFTRYLVSYPSDGLTIYGFMNVPQGEGPFPVIIAIHGYVNPAAYSTLDYTTRYADALARAGYLVLHPNLRGYRPSDDGLNTFRIGHAIDVLNLIATVQAHGGESGPLEKARPDSIGLWGHSMGGGIALRVITVDPDVRAALLYGSMSGDERLNYERVQMWSNGASGQEELETPEEALQRISPIAHLDRIEATVSIHHGEEDDVVPPAWSRDLCTRLREAGKAVDCIFYPGQPHTFRGNSDQIFIERSIAFFDAQLKFGS